MSVSIHRHFEGPWPAGAEPRGADIYSRARQLLAAATITPETLLEIWGQELSGNRSILRMSGIAGDLAKLAVVEYKSGYPTSRIAHWRPFQGARSGSETGKSDFPVQCSVPAAQAPVREDAA